MIVEGEKNQVHLRSPEYVEVGSGEPIESEDLMEFRLLYVGNLFATGATKTRADHKHELRRQFHPQLRRLWEINKNLRLLACHSALLDRGQSTEWPWLKRPEVEESWFKAGIAVMGKNWSRVGYQFVPLITSKIAVRCSIEILLLRPEEERFIFGRGDIDGQIKTLFDALRMPADLAEAGGIGPQEDEDPFFCLLEDDKLISEVHVTTDQLLLLPAERKVRANTCAVVLHVKVNHKTSGSTDQYFV
jgi:hypothetical protein